MSQEFQNLAQEIVLDWKNPYFGAKPYMSAMLHLTSIRDTYGVEPGSMIVRYFLSNATTWRGDTARRVKARLNEMLKEVKNDSAN